MLQSQCSMHPSEYNTWLHWKLIRNNELIITISTVKEVFIWHSLPDICCLFSQEYSHKQSNFKDMCDMVYEHWHIKHFSVNNTSLHVLLIFSLHLYYWQLEHLYCIYKLKTEVFVFPTNKAWTTEIVYLIS